MKVIAEPAGHPAQTAPQNHGLEPAVREPPPATPLDRPLSTQYPASADRTGDHFSRRRSNLACKRSRRILTPLKTNHLTLCDHALISTSRRDARNAAFKSRDFAAMPRRSDSAVAATLASIFDYISNTLSFRLSTHCARVEWSKMVAF